MVKIRAAGAQATHVHGGEEQLGIMGPRELALRKFLEQSQSRMSQPLPEQVMSGVKS